MRLCASWLMPRALIAVCEGWIGVSAAILHIKWGYDCFMRSVMGSQKPGDMITNIANAMKCNYQDRRRSYRFFSCSFSSISRIAALWFRLPPNFGPLRTSSCIFPPGPRGPTLLLGGGCGGLLRRLRCCIASRNSRLNSSAIRSSAARSS
jgi:hypothetical protein